MWNLRKRKQRTGNKKHNAASASNTASSSQHITPKALSPPSTSNTLVSSSNRDERSLSEPSISSLSAPAPSSTFGLTLTSSRSRSRSGDRSKDPLGLTVVYEPETAPSTDIIFVHGLGGTSRATWSKGRNPENFWPEKWLPTEPGIQSARILSFGYNANFASTRPTPITGITDFANDLLYSMKFGKDDNLGELNLGQRSIIFIVHSMGGLVVKQAYILGQNDSHYSEIVSSVSAILFLATPHRGSDLAEVLNRILTVSIFNHSPKLYVSELKNGSPTIQALNEQFRHLAPKLDILSFYETLPTAVGPKKMMVVEKQSATLGYAAEISKSLIADHHTVCKYDGVEDTNYISVRNALKTLITAIRSKGQHIIGTQSGADMENIETLLAVTESYRDDLEFFRMRWTEGTCEWILKNPSFNEWCDEREGTSMLWLHALPASGKSILSSFIVDHLLKESFCAYFFFRFGTQSKRSMSTCLRTIAFQIAEQLPSFRRKLKDLRLPSKTLEKADARTIWERVFLGILFKMRIATTMYWVIDALDESENPQALVELMQGVSRSSSLIKILLVSRQTSELIQTFERLSIVVPVGYLPIEHTRRDIRIYVKKEVQYMHASDDFKAQIIERLVAGAIGNFLWASLALVEVMKCNTEEDLDETLKGIPIGMEKLYQRMERTIIEKSRPQDQKLGQMILTWAACSRRLLLLKELTQALRPEFSVMMDLKFIVNRVCGQFLVVDSSDRLVMVHQTARDHIISTDSVLAVRVSEAHEALFTKCLSVIDEKQFRRDTDRRPFNSKTPDYSEFLRYAMTSWNYHLNLTSSESDAPLMLLAKFLRTSSVLAWIAWLASKNLLKVLVYSSKAMTRYAWRKRKRYAETNPLLHRIRDLDLVESWATDFLKLIGRFGPNLVVSPSAIYQQVPPFCPTNSAIFRQFGQNAPQPHSLTVDGISKEDWDDSVAKLSIGAGSRALLVSCAGDHIAVADGQGQIVLYNSATFEVKRTLKHAERICAMSFSGCSNLLATYGFATTKVWSVNTGQIMYKIKNPRGGTALTIVFAEGDTKLMVGCSDRLLRFVPLTVPDPAWIILHPTLLKDDTVLDRPVSKVPWRIAFNAEASCVAVAYRDFPMSVWSLDADNPAFIGRAMRSREYAGNSWTVVNQVIWHPDSDEVLGLYLGGHVFRWNPFNDTQQELQAEAAILASSPDGQFFATGDCNGTIKLFNFHHFSLIYQLSCENLINGICFSPDGKRLYDVREHFCNVWEPNALIRSGGHNNQDNEAESEMASIPTLAISEAFAELRHQITAVAIQFKGRYQAIGNEAGAVSIVDTLAAHCRAVPIWQAPVPLPIGHLDWSQDGNYLACSELTGRAVVKEVQLSSEGFWTATPYFDVKLIVHREGIQQILLNNDGSMLMIKNGPTVTVWSLSEKSRSETEITSITVPDTKWMKHPSDPRLLLAYSPTKLRVHLFDGLSELAVFDTEHPSLQALHHAADENQTVEMKVDSLHTTSCGSSCLVDIIHTTAKCEKRFTGLYEIPKVGPSCIDLGSRAFKALPPDIQEQIEIPLGVIPKQRLIYLDKSYWMCSYRVGSNPETEKVQRYYFLPKDWLNMECLERCALLGDGKFLIPNNGELAIVECRGMSVW